MTDTTDETETPDTAAIYAEAVEAAVAAVGEVLSRNGYVFSDERFMQHYIEDARKELSNGVRSYVATAVPCRHEQIRDQFYFPPVDQSIYECKCYKHNPPTCPDCQQSICLMCHSVSD